MNSAPISDTLTQIASKPKRPQWYRSPKLLRHAVMAFFFVFLLHVAYDHQIKGGGPRGTPSVEAYCPFGGLESLYQFLTTGGFVRRIEPSSMVLFAALVLLTVIASRGFCGWICPFGSVQEWLGLAGKRLFRGKYNPSGNIDRILRYFKYVVLAVIVVLTWRLGALVFRDYDPFLAFFHLGRGVSELLWAYAILGMVLIGSLYVERFFCKYACPLGALLGILGKAGLTKIHRDPTHCKECNACQKKCHGHIDFLSATTIRSSECNHCMDCVVDCPKPNVLSVRGPRLRFSHPVYASMLVVGLFLLVGTSKLAGKWQTKPAMVSFTDQSGKLDPENIRGWMTLAEISSGYHVPIEHLYASARLPDKAPPSSRLNTIASTYQSNFEPDKVREIVRNYLDGKAAPAAKHGPGKASASPPSSKRASGEHGGGDEQEVKGFMTLNEIAMKTGVPAAFILKKTGLPADTNLRVPVREWMHEKGKSIQDLRDAVAAYRAGAR